MQLRWLVEKVLETRYNTRWDEYEDYISYTEPRLQYREYKGGTLLWKNVPTEERVIDNRRKITPIKDITANID